MTSLFSVPLISPLQFVGSVVPEIGPGGFVTTPGSGSLAIGGGDGLDGDGVIYVEEADDGRPTRSSLRDITPGCAAIVGGGSW